MVKGLYVHIPFCRNVCGYCDFVKCRYNPGLAEKYLSVLKMELETIRQDSFETVYIGGGTPTALNYSQLKNLLEMLSVFKVNQEYTIEINPESFDEDKARLLKQYGVNRASVGVQSFNEHVLKVMNRQHTNADVERTISLLKENGINNISIDLIFGLGSQGLMDVIDDLQKAVNLDITHISVYDLEIWPNTEFGMKNYQKADEERCALMYQSIIDYLNSHSYYQYEVSNFALADNYSRHNTLYWQYEDYYGVGLGACGKIGDMRYENTHNFVEYLQGQFRKEVLYQNYEEQLFETIMMGLRMVRGISISDFNQRYHTDLLSHYQKAVDKNLERNLLVLKDGNIYCSGEGMMVLNDILVDFMMYV